MFQQAVKPFHIVAVCLFLLQGCAAIVVGGAATGAAVIHDQRTTGTVIEDQAIELKAASAIYKDKELRSKTHINFTSYNNILLVTGEAPDEGLRDRIIEKVGNIEKVRHVYDEVAISAPSSLTSRSSDSLLTASVKTKLFTIRDFDATRIKVVSENGIVYLMGLVTQREGGIAAEVTRRVKGVRKVVKLFEYGEVVTP